MWILQRRAERAEWNPGQMKRSQKCKGARTMVGPHNEGSSLVRTMIKGIMEWKRPRITSLEWMMQEDYSELKNRAGQQGEWRHWLYTPVCRKVEYTKKKQVTVIRGLIFKQREKNLYNEKELQAKLHPSATVSTKWHTFSQRSMKQGLYVLLHNP